MLFFYFLSASNILSAAISLLPVIISLSRGRYAAIHFYEIRIMLALQVNSKYFATVQGSQMWAYFS